MQMLRCDVCDSCVLRSNGLVGLSSVRGVFFPSCPKMTLSHGPESQPPSPQSSRLCILIVEACPSIGLADACFFFLQFGFPHLWSRNSPFSCSPAPQLPSSGAGWPFLVLHVWRASLARSPAPPASAFSVFWLRIMCAPPVLEQCVSEELVTRRCCFANHPTTPEISVFSGIFPLRLLGLIFFSMLAEYVLGLHTVCLSFFDHLWAVWFFFPELYLSPKEFGSASMDPHFCGPLGGVVSVCTWGLCWS